MQRQWLTISILSALIVYGCATATYKPPRIEESSLRDRARTEEKDGIRVTAAVLSAEECKEFFLLDLYKKGIQPVRLRIENNTSSVVAFLPYGVDSDYFSPLEVAYMHRSGFSKDGREQMDMFFHQQKMQIYIPPGTDNTGFVFTNLDEGTKSFNVDVLGENKKVWTFTFLVSVPGLRVSHSEVDFFSLYTRDEIGTYDEEGLRKALESLPCCTNNEDSTEQGAPINLVLIGDGDEVHGALIRSDWYETEALSGRAATERGKSSIYGSKYATVSPLYVYDRPQDAAFRQARETIKGQNILRLWLTPMRFQGKLVWLGQASREVGVRSVLRRDVTYRIDADLDNTRDFLFLQNVWNSQMLARYSFVKGVGAASISEPRMDLKGDPYFTDGFRAVLWLSSRPISRTDVKFVEWEIPTPR